MHLVQLGEHMNLFHVLRSVFFSFVVLVRKGKDGKAEIVIIDHGLYEILHPRWVSQLGFVVFRTRKYSYMYSYSFPRGDSLHLLKD